MYSARERRAQADYSAEPLWRAGFEHRAHENAAEAMRDDVHRLAGYGVEERRKAQRIRGEICGH